MTKDDEELRLLYRVSTSDIAFFKRQQWVVTNYVLAIYAALIFIADDLLCKPSATWKQYVLTVLVYSTLIAGICVIFRLQDSILGRRLRLSRVRGHFGNTFNNAWEIPKSRDDIYWLLILVMSVGALIVTWLFLIEHEL